jgi:hypothetical protein
VVVKDMAKCLVKLELTLGFQDIEEDELILDEVTEVGPKGTRIRQENPP